MIFESETGFIKDKKTGQLFIYMPALALDDFDLLCDCLELLQEIEPIEEDTLIH